MEFGPDKGIILVLGATGHQGGAVARHLLEKKYSVRFMTRKPDSPKAKELETLGANPVIGDLDDADAVKAALSGVRAVFAVFTMAEKGVEWEAATGKRFVKSALDAGVSHFVYSSVGSADRRTGIPHFESKARIEEAVRKAGFPSWTILRPVFFMDNIAGKMTVSGLEEGKLAMGVQPGTRLQMISVEDIGRFGLLAFEKSAEMNGQSIDIAGDDLTMPEVAEILSRILDRRIDFVSLPQEEVRAISRELAIMDDWFDRVGYSADIDGIRSKYGIQPLRFEEWAEKVKWSVPIRL